MSGCGSTRPTPTSNAACARSAQAACCGRNGSPTRWPKRAFAARYEGARQFATSERLISRTHFARFLVAAGHASDVKSVFNRFLVRGKPGYAPHAWATLRDAVGWITGAGGQAVLAHPGRYKLGRSGMRRLLAEFREAGGAGIEVLSPSHTPEQVVAFSGHARVFGLMASAGSDYHGPGESWMDLGGLPDMPAGVVPVWNGW